MRAAGSYEEREAWETVQASGVRYPEAKAEQVRAILAKHIIAAATDGERDRGRLRDGRATRFGSIKSAERVCESTQLAERRSIAYQS
jgi:hypothetical protein